MCEALNLKDGASALQSVEPFLLKVPPDGGLGVWRSSSDMYGACAWLFSWPWSMHMPKYALNVLCWWLHSLSRLKVCRPRFEPCAASETAIEYHPASNSSQRGMPIFGGTAAFFCIEKKKVKPFWQHCWAVPASCEVLLLRTLTVKHVAAFLKSSYLWLHDYSLDMLLLFNMILELHLSVQITYAGFVQ